MRPLALSRVPARAAIFAALTFVVLDFRDGSLATISGRHPDVRFVPISAMLIASPLRHRSTGQAQICALLRVSIKTPSYSRERSQ
jgi:hypothetical protein